MGNADASPRKEPSGVGGHISETRSSLGKCGGSGCECVGSSSQTYTGPPRPSVTLRSLEIAFDGSARIMRTSTPNRFTGRLVTSKSRRRNSMPVKANPTCSNSRPPPLWALDWKGVELHPGRQPKYTRNKRFVMHWRSMQRDTPFRRARRVRHHGSWIIMPT